MELAQDKKIRINYLNIEIKGGFKYLENYICNKLIIRIPKVSDKKFIVVSR